MHSKKYANRDIKYRLKCRTYFVEQTFTSSYEINGEIKRGQILPMPPMKNGGLSKSSDSFILNLSDLRYPVMDEEREDAKLEQATMTHIGLLCSLENFNCANYLTLAVSNP